MTTGAGEAAWRAARGLPAGAPLAIGYLGVWDTVGALGVPGHLALARRLNRGLGFHDTALSGLVGAARHAVAIDERRRTFPPTLWDNLDAMNGGAEGAYAQRWFPGDHGSVGGGGAVSALSDEALVWVAEGAADARPGARPGGGGGVAGRLRLPRAARLAEAAAAAAACCSTAPTAPGRRGSPSWPSRRSGAGGAIPATGRGRCGGWRG